jgi:hypothetical protein
MVLIEAGQQGRGESGEAMFRRIAGGALDAVLVAVRAAVVDVGGHMADEVLQTVILLNADLHADGWSVFQQTVPPGFVFFPRMDIGVVPESHRLDPLVPKGFNAGKGAGGAAGMQQNRVHKRPSLL